MEFLVFWCAPVEGRAAVLGCRVDRFIRSSPVSFSRAKVWWTPLEQAESPHEGEETEGEGEPVCYRADWPVGA